MCSKTLKGAKPKVLDEYLFMDSKSKNVSSLITRNVPLCEVFLVYQTGFLQVTLFKKTSETVLRTSAIILRSEGRKIQIWLAACRAM